eukprot:TRINITY_DN8836_c0_g1_i2.p1 TRINITY_DN8836_c0_g1~~TRINITY_DN8836_c0_g1_i2.p1  ORF type:complete len:191 (+),score=26.28 TRINITY_DN8836_c0_g1_i2:209-781(+)
MAANGQPPMTSMPNAALGHQMPTPTYAAPGTYAANRSAYATAGIGTMGYQQAPNGMVYTTQQPTYSYAASTVRPAVSREGSTVPTARQATQNGREAKMTRADKRAHHNALERKRRDHIKDSFVSLRDAIPSITGEKVSRAAILNKATGFIQNMRSRNAAHRAEMEELRRQNEAMLTQSKLKNPQHNQASS